MGDRPKPASRPPRPRQPPTRAASLPISGQATRAAVKAAQAAVAKSRDRLSKLPIRPPKPTFAPRCMDCGAVIRRQDDGTLDGWWAVNFGVLICHQCASCHRGLGRHLSTIQRAPDAAIAPLVEIISKEANKLWEAVMPPQVKPFAPSPIDEKARFVTNKYVHRRYIRPPPLAGIPHIKGQLRTAVLRNDLIGVYTALCYGVVDIASEPEDCGLTALHLAACLGHRDVVELLLLHGANPALEVQGDLPEKMASSRGFLEVASRLRAARNIIFTAFNDFTLDLDFGPSLSPDGAGEASPLSALDKEQLETLVVDMYDEVCRRSDEEAWQATTTPAIRKGSIPVLFLPLVERLPQERQQSRQKLATLGKRQFGQLIRDLLAEMDRRRFAGVPVSRPCSRRPSVRGVADPGTMPTDGREMSPIDAAGERPDEISGEGGEEGEGTAELREVVRRLEGRVGMLEALVAELDADRRKLRATLGEQARTIAELREVSGGASSGLASAAEKNVPENNERSEEDFEPRASIASNASSLPPPDPSDPPDVLAKRMSDQTNSATSALQGVFAAAKEGDRKRLAECVRQLSAEVCAFEAVLAVVAPGQSMVALHETVALLQTTLLSSNDREIMLKAYAVANEISALVDTL